MQSVVVYGLVAALSVGCRSDSKPDVYVRTPDGQILDIDEFNREQRGAPPRAVTKEDWTLNPPRLRPTPAEIRSFADAVVERFIGDLTDRGIYEINESETRVVVLMGDFDNQSRGKFRDNDLKILARQVQNQLVNSDWARAAIDFRIRRADRVKYNDEEFGVDRGDPFGRGDSDSEDVNLSGSDVFRLDFSVNLSEGGGEREYYIYAQLIRVQDGGIAWSDEYTRTYGLNR